MMDPLIELEDIDDDNLSIGTWIDEPKYLYLFNKTNFPAIEYLPARFNQTSVAFLSGAILFVLLNTAFLMAYITSKGSKKKPTSSYGSNENHKGNNNERIDKEDDYYFYDDYYDDYYYYEDIIHNNHSSNFEENPR